LVEAEETIVISHAKTPCSLGIGRTYSYNRLSEMPGGMNAKRPWLLPKPQRLIIQHKSMGNEKNIEDLVLEVAVASRGEATVAKDWRLCLLRNNVPYRFRPEEMNAENRSMLNGGVSLLDVPLIEHGREVNGWLLFRIPADVLV
jgi:hypothetical protein